MKKTLIFLSLLVFLISCETQKKEINISSLNGYWEIEKAIAPNGEEKPYAFNAFVDFFNVKTDSTGYRAKLKPNFRGTYEGNNIKQNFKISDKEGVYSIHYKINNTTWSETLIEASPKRFVIKNKEGVSYIYKPFTPITVK